MVSCDFCPLVFHLDCLHPPLTIPPATVWMCPAHPHNKIVRANSPCALSPLWPSLCFSLCSIPLVPWSLPRALVSYSIPIVPWSLTLSPSYPGLFLPTCTLSPSCPCLFLPVLYPPHALVSFSLYSIPLMPWSPSPCTLSPSCPSLFLPVLYPPRALVSFLCSIPLMPWSLSPCRG
jgi:hypothetical protein